MNEIWRQNEGCTLTIDQSSLIGKKANKNTCSLESCIIPGVLQECIRVLTSQLLQLHVCQDKSHRQIPCLVYLTSKCSASYSESSGRANPTTCGATKALQISFCSLISTTTRLGTRPDKQKLLGPTLHCSLMKMSLKETMQLKDASKSSMRTRIVIKRMQNKYKLYRAQRAVIPRTSLCCLRNGQSQCGRDCLTW